MKTFKRILSILLVVLLGTTCSCSKKNTKPSFSSSTQEESSSINNSISSNNSSSGNNSSTNQEPSLPEYNINDRQPLDNNEVKYLAPAVDTFYNYIEVFDDQNRLCTIGDPFIMRYNGKFYMYSSCTGNHLRVGIPCWVSDNMVDWEFCSWVWGDGRTDYGTEGLTYNAYAPEIIYYKGWFYLCEAPNGAGHYIFRSKTPYDKFELCSENLGLGIDGSFYISQEGELYILSAKDGLKYTKLLIENDRVKLDGEPKSINNAYLYSWTEGPEAFERNGYKYLFYTGNHVNSAGYRMAYSYTTSAETFQDLQSVDNNIILLNTGDDTPYNKKGYNSNDTYKELSSYRGLGHGCPTYGPNLDSIYLGYHNQGPGRLNHAGSNEGANGFDRRYNITQMFSNKEYISTNGICITDTPKPTKADFYTNSLTLNGNYKLSSQVTKNVYTAEINFLLNQNSSTSVVVGYSGNSYTEITISGSTLNVVKNTNGNTQTLLTKTILTSENMGENYHCIKVVNGYCASTIYYDNVLVASLNSAISGAGQIGVKGDVINGAVAFTNDAYGTSDFESFKNLSSTFPAYTYLKEENRGYSIKNATIKNDGVRQGEKESTLNLGGATAISLQSGDWVKYAINAPTSGTYAFNVEVDKNSLGCIFEVIIDETNIYKMEIKNIDFGTIEFVYANAGTFDIFNKGIHSLKVRVYSGTLNMRAISTQADAKANIIQESLSTEFASGKHVMGNVSFNNGLVTSSSDVRTLYYVGNKGVANVEFSVDVTLASGGVAGLLFRAKNFSYSKSLATVSRALQGYYLYITQNSIILYKYNYNTVNNVMFNYYKQLGTSTNNIKIRANQNVIELYLNGEKVKTKYDDFAFMDGYCGIYNENSSATYSNLVYKPL